jgi:hypothetical protein
VNLQAIKKLLLAAALATTLPACAPIPPPNFNSLEFARRPPYPGRPTYIETIRYIDDGLRFVDPTSGFFVSPDGRMCFRGVLNVDRTVFEYSYDWCLSPMAVSRVEALRNEVTGVPQILLWCKHSDPECAEEISYSHRATNFVTVQIIPSDQEKAAVEHLIYLMGGRLGDSEPFARFSPPWRFGREPVALIGPPAQ